MIRRVILTEYREHGFNLAQIFHSYKKTHTCHNSAIWVIQLKKMFTNTNCANLIQISSVY